LRDRKRRRLRAVVDTCVLVAGISAFKRREAGAIPSAVLLRDWIENGTFIWLVTEDILAEYKAILRHLGVRRRVIGTLINLLREEAETVRVSRSAELSPDPGDDAFCDCAEQGRADFVLTLNPADFPQEKLRARVIVPGSATVSLP
jgi:predicted nucleic acid-binding protein